MGALAPWSGTVYRRKETFSKIIFGQNPLNELYCLQPHISGTFHMQQGNQVSLQLGSSHTTAFAQKDHSDKRKDTCTGAHTNTDRLSCNLTKRLVSLEQQ